MKSRGWAPSVHTPATLYVIRARARRVCCRVGSVHAIAVSATIVCAVLRWSRVGPRVGLLVESLWLVALMFVNVNATLVSVDLALIRNCRRAIAAAIRPIGPVARVSAM